MDYETTALEKNCAWAPKQIRTPGLWKRSWAAYRIKKHSNQTFYATVVAIQVFLLAIFMLSTVFLVIKESNMNSAGLSLLNKF